MSGWILLEYGGGWNFVSRRRRVVAVRIKRRSEVKCVRSVCGSVGGGALESVNSTVVDEGVRIRSFGGLVNILVID